jgi:hypothetical protein
METTRVTRFCKAVQDIPFVELLTHVSETRLDVKLYSQRRNVIENRVKCAQCEIL